ncbi:MAG: hypothetical protein ILM98_01890 [Kiritimatiellae bacterium]|nr:hypothetical protein [Kiritimatiellia bacterium]
MKGLVLYAAIATGAALAALGGVAAEIAAAGAFVVAAPSHDCFDASAALQALIDSNPNRTIYIPDGTWMLSRPVVTPAAPSVAVSLRLGDFAILKAAPDFPAGQPLVRLGGSHPSRDIRAPGSVYGLYGGIIDGSEIADGVTIESGRETRVQNVSMKNVRIGLHVLHGANSGSADCDVRDVHVVGNRAPDSVGLLVEAHDNSFANMRIYDCMTGVRIRAGGNRLYNVHPLWSCPNELYGDGVGFDDGGASNTYICSYADQYSTGWLFREKAGVSHMIQCTAFWYAPNPGLSHTAIRCEGPFRTICSAMKVSFRDAQNTNAVLLAEPGGDGVLRDTIVNDLLLNDPGDLYHTHVPLLPQHPRGPHTRSLPPTEARDDP